MMKGLFGAIKKRVGGIRKSEDQIIWKGIVSTNHECKPVYVIVTSKMTVKFILYNDNKIRP